MTRPPRLLLGLGGLLAVLSLARLPAAWASGNALNHVAGAWAALADDLHHGTLYRALYDPALGFGGTRDFPLPFVLHAGAMEAGLPLLAAGYAASLLAAALTVLGLALLLRRAGLPAGAAALLAPLALAGWAAQTATGGIRGDLLPVGLTALGLAAVCGPAPGARRLALAAALLALAFAAKITALTGLATGVGFLLLCGERRRALALAGLGAAFAAAALGATELLSGGRFLEVMRACASGGADARSVLTGPVRVLYHLRFTDRFGLALLVGAIAAFVAVRPRDRAAWRAPDAAPLLLAALWLALSLGAVMLVFGSPGTAINHFVELEVASAAVIGAALARALAAPEAFTLRARRVVAGAAFLGVGAGIWCAGLAWALDHGSENRREAIRGAIAALPPHARLLSEDPLVPLLAGERPLVLDAWMLRLVADRDPAFSAPIVAALDAGQFDAVVLMTPVEHPDLSGPSPRHLGTPVVEAIRRRYRLAATSGLYRVYVPAAAPGDGGGGARIEPAGSPAGARASLPSRL